MIIADFPDVSGVRSAGGGYPPGVTRRERGIGLKLRCEHPQDGKENNAREED